MKIQQWIFPLISILFLITACDEPVPVEETGYEAPAPPTEIKQNNLITVEFYSKLNDESLFGDQNYQSVVSHIAATNAPLAFFFDRSDAVIGETSPAVQIAWETKAKAFFVQNNVNQTSIHGTGMIIRPVINAFEGIGHPDSLFLAGFTMSAPISQPILLTLMTCKLTGTHQFPLLVNTLGEGFTTNKILIGTIKNNLIPELQLHLKKNMKNFRLSFFSSTASDKTYQLFFLTPAIFVNREVKALMVGTTPMYECKIEYLN